MNPMKRILSALVLVFLATALSGCGELDDLTGAQIASLQIDPDTLSLSDTGMTDEFFTATMVVSGFEDEVDVETAVVFLQDPERVEAAPGFREIEGDTITLGMIAKTWVGGLEPGAYSVGAEVSSATETVRQLDLATITIVE
jgi:hypothetical protein